jgi:predicted SAM-dependent methyltransferase
MGLTVLHAGCGSSAIVDSAFSSYEQVRLDIDQSVNPDILASITAMPMIEDQTYDAVYCHHCLEHLGPAEVPQALAEFHRVLKPNGLLMLAVPDLHAIAKALADDKIDQVIYVSEAGPVTALDMIYGHRASIMLGNRHMGHRSGFTPKYLEKKINEAGFGEVKVRADSQLNLWGTGRCQQSAKLSDACSTPTLATNGSRSTTSTTRESSLSMCGANER